VCKLEGSWRASNHNWTHDVCHFKLFKLLIISTHLARAEIMHCTVSLCKCHHVTGKVSLAFARIRNNGGVY
jgi:hypothetical protein